MEISIWASSWNRTICNHLVVLQTVIKGWLHRLMGASIIGRIKMLWVHLLTLSKLAQSTLTEFINWFKLSKWFIWITILHKDTQQISRRNGMKLLNLWTLIHMYYIRSFQSMQLITRTGSQLSHRLLAASREIELPCSKWSQSKAIIVISSNNLHQVFLN